MSEFLDKLEARPTSHKVFGWFISLALLSAVFWFNFYKGKSTELNELQERENRQQDSILALRKKARMLPELRKEIAGLDSKLEEVLIQLPERKKKKNLLASIDSLAKDTGLEVIKFNPQPEIIRDFYAEVPTYIEVEGTFHELATFFDEVGKLARIVNIDRVTIDINTETKTEVFVRSSCYVTSYRFLDESERAAKVASEEEEGKKGKKRRRRR